MATPNIDDKIKSGIKTTEFYLALFVTIAGVAVQFLPPDKSSTLIRIIGIVSSLLSALGYTVSRTIVKTN